MGKDAKGHGSNPGKISAAEGRQLDKLRENRERGEAMMKQIKAEGAKPQPKGKLFNDSPKTKREVRTVMNAEKARGRVLIPADAPTGRASAPINRRGDTFKPKGSK